MTTLNQTKFYELLSSCLRESNCVPLDRDCEFWAEHSLEPLANHVRNDLFNKLVDDVIDLLARGVRVSLDTVDISDIEDNTVFYLGSLPPAEPSEFYDSNFCLMCGRAGSKPCKYC